MSINRPIPANTLAVLTRLANSGDKLCQAIVSLNSREPSGTFTNANRPPAASVPVGTEIWNTDTSGPNFSNGTVWKTIAELATSANITRYIGTAAIGRGDGSSAQNAMLFDDAMDSLPPIWGGQCRFFFQGAGPFLWTRDHAVGIPLGLNAEPLTFIGSYTQVATFTIDSVSGNAAHATVAPGVDYTGYTLRVTTPGPAFGVKVPITDVQGNNIFLAQDISASILPASFACEIIRPGASITPVGAAFRYRKLNGSGKGNSKVAMFGISFDHINNTSSWFNTMTMNMMGCRFDGNNNNAGPILFNVELTNAYPDTIGYRIDGVIESSDTDFSGIHCRRFNGSDMFCSTGTVISGTFAFTEHSFLLVVSGAKAFLSTFVCVGANNNGIWVQDGSELQIWANYFDNPVSGRIKSAVGTGIRIEGGSKADISGLDISSCGGDGIKVFNLSNIVVGSSFYGFVTSAVNNGGYGLNLAAGCLAHMGAAPAASPLSGALGNTIVGGTVKTWANNIAPGGSTVNGAHIDAD